MKKINKKGFTLVEIIVVIAIIGILAAILVPTLMGYTVKSQVTSANSTAASLKKNINAYLLQADVGSYGMKISESSVSQVIITVTNGEWTVNVTNPSAFLTNKRNWSGTGAGKRDDAVAPTDSAEKELAVYLANLFPEVHTAYIGANLQAGNCNALYFTDETDVSFTMQTFVNSGWSNAGYIWNGDTAGVCSEGYIVGTAPVLQLA